MTMYFHMLYSLKLFILKYIKLVSAELSVNLFVKIRLNCYKAQTRAKVVLLKTSRIMQLAFIMETV